MIALDLIVLIPLVLAVVAPLSARVSDAAPRWIALLGSITQLALMLSLGAAGLWTGEQLTSQSTSAFGGLWSLVTDGLSTPLLALTALIGVMAVASSWQMTKRPGAHFGLLLLLQAALAAVFMADNLILFYVAWESVLVPMFFLIAGWGSSDARRAAMKFLVFTFAGGAVLLAGIIYLSLSTQNAVFFADVAERSAQIPLPALAFWLLAIGFLVKLPALGVHTWLPDAHTEAPTAGSIVLAGVLLKMGGYGLIRLGMPLVPAGFESARPILAALGVAGIVVGAASALVQTDLKRLVAYSSVAHMGFVLLAISAATPTALAGALIGMVSHGFVAGVLFFLVGALYERTHTREITRYGGLGAVVPAWSVAFVYFSLASAGLPGLSGFPGELIALVEGFSAWGWWMLVTGFGIVLAAAYNLRAVRRTVQGPLGDFTELADIDPLEAAVTISTAAAVLALGVAPWLVTAPAVAALTAISRAVSGGQ